MEFQSGKTVEQNKGNNNGYPVCKMTIHLTKHVNSWTYIGDDKIILGGNEEMKLFEGQSKLITKVSKEHNGRINCLIKLSDGRLASGGQDNTIKIWDINKKEILFNLKGHTSIIRDIRELEENKLIPASDDNSCKIWDLNEKRIIYFIF